MSESDPVDDSYRDPNPEKCPILAIPPATRVYNTPHLLSMILDEVMAPSNMKYPRRVRLDIMLTSKKCWMVVARRCYTRIEWRDYLRLKNINHSGLRHAYLSVCRQISVPEKSRFDDAQEPTDLVFTSSTLLDVQKDCPNVHKIMSEPTNQADGMTAIFEEGRLPRLVRQHFTLVNTATDAAAAERAWTAPQWDGWDVIGRLFLFIRLNLRSSSHGVNNAYRDSLVNAFTPGEPAPTSTSVLRIDHFPPLPVRQSELSLEDLAAVVLRTPPGTQQQPRPSGINELHMYPFPLFTIPQLGTFAEQVGECLTSLSISVCIDKDDLTSAYFSDLPEILDLVQTRLVVLKILSISMTDERTQLLRPGYGGVEDMATVERRWGFPRVKLEEFSFELDIKGASQDRTAETELGQRLCRREVLLLRHHGKSMLRDPTPYGHAWQGSVCLWALRSFKYQNEITQNAFLVADISSLELRDGEDILWYEIVDGSFPDRKGREIVDAINEARDTIERVQEEISDFHMFVDTYKTEVTDMYCGLRQKDKGGREYLARILADTLAMRVEGDAAAETLRSHGVEPEAIQWPAEADFDRVSDHLDTIEGAKIEIGVLRLQQERLEEEIAKLRREKDTLTRSRNIEVGCLKEKLAQSCGCV